VNIFIKFVMNSNYENLESSSSSFNKGEESEEKHDENIHKEGTFLGVFLPTASNVLGALIYVRDSSIISEIGLGINLLTWIIVVITLLFTILSVSALSTNGTIKGGGSYYLISRNLSPELGGFS
jgi:potassium/chloride transporter 9